MLLWCFLAQLAALFSALMFRIFPHVIGLAHFINLFKRHKIEPVRREGPQYHLPELRDDLLL